MSGGEIGAALEFITVASEIVYYVMGSIKDGRDLSAGFNHGVNTKAIAALIEQAKASIIAEIQHVKLEEYMNTIDGTVAWWSRCQITIKDYGISKHTVSDPDGELRNFSDDILGVIRDLDELVSFVETNELPRPHTPKMLGIYLAYYGVRHSVLSAYEAFELARTNHLSSSFKSTVAEFENAPIVLNKRFEEYISTRALQIEVVQRPIAGDPPASWPWYVTQDHGGDGLIPKFASGTESPGKNTYPLVKGVWNKSDFVKQDIRKILDAYKTAHKNGLPLLKPEN